MKQLAKRVMKKALERSGYELLGTKNSTTLAGHLRQVFDLLGINCVFDVGANEGQYGRFLRGLGYRGSIISFEPVEAAYSVLQRNTINDGNWTAVNLALGSKNVVGSLNVTNGSDLSSFLTLSDYGLKTLFQYQNDNRPITETKSTKTVELRRLDCVCEDLIKGIVNPRVFLKMDTQGYDLEVMKGAKHCLDKVLGLQSEVSVLPLYQNMPNYLESLRFFTESGYALTGLYTVIREPETFKIVEYDCVMVRDQ